MLALHLGGLVPRRRAARTVPQTCAPATLSPPTPQAAPPGVAYVARLVKQLIAAADGDGQELDEALLQLQVALLQAAAGATDQQQVRTTKQATD